ncbi:MAG: ABC transporter ATP-binding protein [Velocimicrobium sp.]
MKKGTIQKIGIYLKKYWLFVILSVLLAAGTVVTTLYIPILIGNAIDRIIGAGTVFIEQIIPILWKIAICMIATSIFQWLLNTCNNYITYHVTNDIRSRAFKKITILPLNYMDQNGHGEILSKIVTDVDQFADGLLMGFTQFFSGVLTIVGTICFMLSINLTITCVVVLITPLSLFVASYIAKKTYMMFRLQSQTRAEITGYIDEMIGNQKVVIAFSHQKKSLEEFDEMNVRLEKASLSATFFSSITNPATRFVNSIVYTSVGVVGAYLVILGRISVGQLSSFLSYSNQYTKPFNEITGVISELQNAIACAERIFEFIEEKPQVPDAQNAIDSFLADGQVTLSHLVFSYTKDRELIRDFNLSVKPGQRVAIVGPTGCGKTTIINLLMRFYDVEAGSIQIDGYNSENLTRRSIRENFGMVLQDTWLKTASIRENIALGKPDSTEEEIVEAAKATHAHSFIKRLPNGYDTLITEDGGNLSQGQKQLLCITRVMLCLPPMLILDEATSSIDTRTEIKIQKAFDTLMEGRTSFVVAHRLSTIKEADIILVMKDGKIIEQGKHEELLYKNGFYANLYNSQFADASI